MIKKQIPATLVYFENKLYGALFGEEDYFVIGGALLVQAFKGHHVQLVRECNGRIQIIDDMNSGAFAFVDGVNTDEDPDETAGEPYSPSWFRWKLSTKQSADVRAALEQYAENEAA